MFTSSRKSTLERGMETARETALETAKTARETASRLAEAVASHRPGQKRRKSSAARRAVLPLLVALGAGLEFFLDPSQGKARRQRVVGPPVAATRRTARKAHASATYTRGRMRGALARARGKGQPIPVDDVEVRNLVRQALARSGFTRQDVLVDVCGSTATLRGELPDRQLILDAEETARCVPGVMAVVNDLHLPGEPAPNKVLALNVR